MKKVNLRDYYPHYKEDKFVEVPDEVAGLLDDYERKEQSYLRMLRRYHVSYPYNFEEDLEKMIISTQLSPCEIITRAHDRTLLYNALVSLSDKQFRRLYMHYFLGWSVTKIAKKEGVDKSRISRSIQAGLRALGKFFEKM